MNNIKKPYQILVIEDNILDFIIVEDLLTERLHDPIKLVNVTNFKDANQANNMMSQSDIKNHGLAPDFTNCKADFVAAHEVFFPGKNYTDQEIAVGLKSNGFDALLLVHYYKGANDTTVTNGFISRGLFGSADVNEVTTKLHQIRAELIDAKSSDAVWISDSAETQLDDDYTSNLANALVDNKLVEVASSTPSTPFWKTH